MAEERAADHIIEIKAVTEVTHGGIGRRDDRAFQVDEFHREDKGRQMST